ncbi:MAG: patatin-like phospholipase family protein [Gemmatimonadota bacterium]
MNTSTEKPRLALVLGGGGSKGALQVGLFQAMCQLGLRPDLIVGASVGAINGAFMATGVGPKILAQGWSALRREDLFSFNWRLLWRGASAQSILSARPLRELLERSLPKARFEALPVPLALVTTHLSTGEACVWERGDLIDAIIASSAIPGLLPPVEGHDGVRHVDGSLADNVPIEVALERGATHAIVMNCRTCDRCRRESVGLTDILGQAFSIAADCKLRGLESHGNHGEEVLLLQPEMGEHIRALDFSQGKRLVRAGYEHSLPRLRAWLESQPLKPGRRSRGSRGSGGRASESGRAGTETARRRLTGS